SVLLDMLKIEEDANSKSILNQSINTISEYRIYICSQKEDRMYLSISDLDRPFLWMELFCLCGMIVHGGMYEKYCNEAGKRFSPFFEQIDKDIPRSSYEEVKCEDALRRVLKAFCLVNKE